MRRLIVVALVGIAACRGKEPTHELPVGSVTMSRDTATLVPTATLQLSATIKDVDGNPLSRPISWGTSDPSTATISADGLVTALTTGAVAITATVGNVTSSLQLAVKEGAIIGPSGGTITALAGEATLIVPAGALPADVMITMEFGRNLPLTARLVTGSAVDIEPSGQPFAASAQLRLRYTSTHIPGGAAEPLLRMQREVGTVWQPVDTSTVDTAAKVVSANLTRLDTYAVLTSPISSVSLSTDKATLDLGATLQLRATALDDANVPVVDAPIAWSSADPTIVSVSADGLVTAMDKGGPVDITAISNGRSAKASITVTAKQFVAVSTTTIAFAAAVTGSDPLAQQVAVSSVGTATLDGLTASVTYHAGQPTGWLAASLAASTTPTQLTVQATTGALAAGVYAATVKIASPEPGTGSASISVTFIVSSPSIAINAGNFQAAMAGTALPIAPSVVVRDGNGNALPNASVTFNVIDGAGTATNRLATTDGDGVATVGSWTLGAVANPNSLTATVVGPGFNGDNNSVVFKATGCTGGGGTGYQITLCFATLMSTSRRAAFQDAAARWSSLITSDIADAAVSMPAGTCGEDSPATNMTIDDLMIVASIEPIDGVNGILGSAGPCVIRSSNGLPLIGVMRFDAADVPSLEAAGQFRDVILHEMGHVIGIGSLWQEFGVLANPATVGGPTVDTHYIGTNGLVGFDVIGGSSYAASAKVPVENGFGAGTINSHWRESVLGNELMTGFINNGSNPLSNLTVRSLMDLGYSVNVAGADPFFLMSSLQVLTQAGATRRAYGDDVIHGPMFTIDHRGRLTRIRI